MLTTTEQVWDAFHTPLQQFIRRRVSDEVTAEDVLQDVFLKIHQHIEALRDVKFLLLPSAFSLIIRFQFTTNRASKTFEPVATHE